ncbi:50S rRNA methyltransferase, partial [Vibrio xuii]
MKNELTLHERTLSLYRFPKRSYETLQAWDAGDEYLINHVEELGLEGKRILILNDHVGALSCWFSEKHDVIMMSDSFIAHKGTLSNLHRNECSKV